MIIAINQVLYIVSRLWRGKMASLIVEKEKAELNLCFSSQTKVFVTDLNATFVTNYKINSQK